MYKQSIEDPSRFWGNIASEFHWERKWDTSKPICNYNFDTKKGPVFIEVRIKKKPLANLIYQYLWINTVENLKFDIVLLWKILKLSITTWSDRNVLLTGPIVRFLQWFKGGYTNVCYNALDKHVKEGRGDQTAILWEGNEVGCEKRLTYNDVLKQTCQVRLFWCSILSCTVSKEE